MFASEKNRNDILKLNTIFDFLGYNPRISVDYEIRFNSHTTEQLSLFDEKNHGAEEIINLLARSQRNRYDLEMEISKNINFKSDLYDALNSVVKSVRNGRICTIDLDFEYGFFRSGSLDIFRHILFLRKYGLLSLSDLRLNKSQNNNDISIRDASSGEQAVVLTFLGIAGEIEDNSLVIIDEPEISLHPEWQEKFIDLLTTTFSGYTGCHFILATHSPLLLSNVSEDNCSVVTMDDFSISPAKEFSKKSADYQLAEAFGTPGYRNEYLAREGLAAIRLASHRKFDSKDFEDKIALLIRLRPQLQEDDPVAQITDALVEASRGVTR